MFFKLNQTAKEEQIDFDDLCSLFKENKIPPTALYKSIWTNNEWWSIDNHKAFHKYTPIEYPKGIHLQNQIEVEERLAGTISVEELKKRHPNGIIFFDHSDNSAQAFDFIGQDYLLHPLELPEDNFGVCDTEGRVYDCIIKRHSVFFVKTKKVDSTLPKKYFLQFAKNLNLSDGETQNILETSSDIIEAINRLEEAY